MRTAIITLVAVMALTFTASAATAAPPTPAAHPAAQAHPEWVRSCGWANCSVYFNRSETRIASYGGALLTQLLCVILRSTPAALVCTAIAWAVGKAGDNAVSAGRCVKLSFSRWTGVVYYIGTYSGTQCR